MRISIVVAMTPQGLIAAGGRLPWHMPEDLRHFRRLTTGHTVLMGRKTYDTLRRPLPHRRNMVLSRRGLPDATGVEVFADLQPAIVAAQAAGETELFIIGGAEIYALALPFTQRMVVTFVHIQEPPPDRETLTWFPPWNRQEWRQVEQLNHPPLEFVTLERVAF